MTRAKARNHGRIVRGAIALSLALSASVTVATFSSAAPSKKDVEAAQAKLDALNQHLSLVDEQYNQERIKLQEIQARLAQVREQMAKAQATAERARADLNARAVSAYQGIGSEFELLLGASSFSEFSDRLEFMGNIAQADADLANRAATAQQQEKWAAEQLSQTLQEQQATLASIHQKQAELQAGVAQAKSLYQVLNRKYHDALAAQRAAAAAAAAASQISGISLPPGGPPPAPDPNAQLAIDAAYSVIGTPYVFGAADPSVGFDCSGLTMWAWAHAGVSLPHSAGMQYDALPHVDRSQLQPGDLLFFYTPISHVGIYINPTTMIDADHTGDVVNYRTIYWQYFSGAARP